MTKDTNVAAYLKALCNVNGWRSIRVENGEGVVGIYKAGEGFRVAGGISVPDENIASERLEAEAVDA
jgi:hypothetical protein